MAEDIYAKLREQLELQEWPGIYLFKFIIPNNPETIARTSALFEAPENLHLQPSKTGKYVSVSAKELMLDVDSIIEVYRKSTEIEGIIPL